MSRNTWDFRICGGHSPGQAIGTGDMKRHNAASFFALSIENGGLESCCFKTAVWYLFLF
jgi:hypothetical protein